MKARLTGPVRTSPINDVRHGKVQFSDGLECDFSYWRDTGYLTLRTWVKSVGRMEHTRSFWPKEGRKDALLEALRNYDL